MVERHHRLNEFEQAPGIVNGLNIPINRYRVAAWIKRITTTTNLQYASYKIPLYIKGHIYIEIE